MSFVRGEQNCSPRCDWPAGEASEEKSPALTLRRAG